MTNEPPPDKTRAHDAQDVAPKQIDDADVAPDAAVIDTTAPDDAIEDTGSDASLLLTDTHREPDIPPDAFDDIDTDDDDAIPSEPHPAWWESLRALPLAPHTALLTMLAALITVPFVLIQPPPRWLALVGALAVAAATEGTLQATRRRAIASGVEIGRAHV